MSEKWTPGPWHTGDSLTNDGARAIMCGSGDDRRRVALVDCQRDVKRGEGWRADCQEREANARLIAAAPELYTELAHLVRLLEPLEQSGALNVPGLATLNGARLALSKAGSGS